MDIEFVIDGMLSGTGVRDAVKGGYVDPTALGLSEGLTRSIASWQARYEEAHFDGFPEAIVSKLDTEGRALALKVGKELPDAVVGYFSNGRMERLI